jgi:hypothetical protein
LIKFNWSEADDLRTTTLFAAGKDGNHSILAVLNSVDANALRNNNNNFGSVRKVAHLICVAESIESLDTILLDSESFNQHSDQ